MDIIKKIDEVLKYEPVLRSSSHCKSCGYISSSKSQFTTIKGITICKDCKEAYNKKEEPEYTWVKNLLKK